VLVQVYWFPVFLWWSAVREVQECGLWQVSQNVLLRPAMSAHGTVRCLKDKYCENLLSQVWRHILPKVQVSRQYPLPHVPYGECMIFCFVMTCGCLLGCIVERINWTQVFSQFVLYWCEVKLVTPNPVTSQIPVAFFRRTQSYHDSWLPWDLKKVSVSSWQTMWMKFIKARNNQGV
jgi:hypothetical protein